MKFEIIQIEMFGVVMFGYLCKLSTKKRFTGRSVFVKYY